MSVQYKASGLQRIGLIIAGAVTGVVIDTAFALVGNRAINAGDVIIAAIIGALLGLWISFGERKRKRASSDRDDA